MNSIETFLAAKHFAVAGASADTEKYGYKVFRALADSGRVTYPINPTTEAIDGQDAYPTLFDPPEAPESLSIITPPDVTRAVIVDAIRVGIKNVWMQPGAEDAEASRAARDAGMNVIDDGSCLLVMLARES